MASSSSFNIENASTSKKNNNPQGKNQYQGRPGRDDPYVEELLKKYHREGITDRRELSKRFLSDHGILMSERTVARRKGQLGLHSSRLTTLKLSEEEKRQLILDQMSKDPKGRIGPRTVKKGIFEDTGISLTRDYIIETMRSLDPQAYDARSPHHAREKRKKKLLNEARQGSLGTGDDGNDGSGGAVSHPPDDPGPSSNGYTYDAQASSTALEPELEDMGSTMSQGSGPSPPRELEFEHHGLSGVSSDPAYEHPRTILLTERPQPTPSAMQLPHIAQLRLSSSNDPRPRASMNAHSGPTSTSAAVPSPTSAGPTTPNASVTSRSRPSGLPRVPPTLPLPNPLPAPSNPYAISQITPLSPSTFSNYTISLPPLARSSSFLNTISAQPHSHTSSLPQPPSSALSQPLSSALSQPLSSALSQPASSTLSQPASSSSQPQPSPSQQPTPQSILTSLRETTPLLTSLTRFLQTQDTSSLSGDEAREVLGEAMKCMEAAALLERQIARFAGGVKGILGAGSEGDGVG